MPNIIPPIVSSSPPPLDPIEDDDNDDDDDGDDFGDFTTANFAANYDTDEPKTITDTSWTLPHPKQHFDQPSLLENGMPPQVILNEENASKLHLEDDEDVYQTIDNTSHESVVSAVTDSGNCSASQNSNGTSPITNLEVEDDSNDISIDPSQFQKLCQSGGECQGQSDVTSTEVPMPSLAALEPNQISSDTSGLGDSKDETCNFNRVPVMSCSSAETVPEQNDVNHAEIVFNEKVDDLPHDLDKDQKNDAEPVIAEPNSVANECKIVEGLCSAPVSSEKTAFDENHFEDTSNRKVTDYGDPSVSQNCSEENDHSSNTFTKTASEVIQSGSLSNFDGSLENECLRAMIIPEIPGLDDDFGDFSGITPVEKYLPDSESQGESKEELLSPSRRPTLVLSDDTYVVAAPSSSILSSEELSNHLSNQVKECVSTENENACSSMALEANDHLSFSFKPSSSDDLDNGFADFTQAQVSNEVPVTDQWAEAAQAQVTSKTLASEEPSDFDDFDDFESAEFQSADTLSKVEPAASSLFDLKAIQASLGQLLKENFPLAEENGCISGVDTGGAGGLSGIVLDVEESSIWQGLRDLESTPSLSFQWPGSHSNRGLLGALNIDSRNILFGPKWNTVVPRFAANLGFSPLEPVRAVPSQPSTEPSPRCEIIQPQIVENSKPTSDQSFQEVVPAAQFDWSDSGLINPLDSNKDPSSSPLATTRASGNPVLTTTPVQVEQLLANSKRSTPLSPLEKNRDPSLSPEAVKVLDTLPELAFLSARMLMFPMQSDRNENKL